MPAKLMRNGVHDNVVPGRKRIPIGFLAGAFTNAPTETTAHYPFAAQLL
jgi:hypothetical protein